TVVSPTTITATTPARAAGAVSVVVTTPGGTNAANTLYTYAANSAPVLGAPTASNVTSSRVTLLGTVTYDGGAAVTEQGFIYAPITRSPTPVIGGPGVVQRPSALVAQGLSASESGLQPGTSYALRSYARNSFGLSYSGVTTNFQTGPLLGRLEVRTDDNSVLADNDGYGFGNAATGATKVRTLTVRNVGTTRLINIVAAITGANVASFTRTLPSTTLEPGASMNVAVSFLPAALGTATATVAFSSSETSQPPLRVNLSGNGVTPGAAALSVKVGDTQITDNVGSVDYGNVPLSTSAERVFTLTNTGANNLTDLVLSVTGTHKTDVTLSPLTATVLSAGDSVSFTAYLTPRAVGARSATIQIKSSDTTAQPSFDIPVTATGIVPEIEVLQGTTNIVDNSTTVSFGTTVPVGTNSVRSFTVKNLGTSTLTLGAISFDGLHAADFTATVPASLSLAQNASTTFDVTFRPSSGGARTAALHLLTSDANESPFDIKLSGTGIGPEISVAAGTVQLASGGPAIDFGEVITATSSVARTYTLKNLGNAPLTGISVSSDSPRFVIGGTPAGTLDAGKTATFTLTFSPNADGPFTGTISIASNDFDEATFTLPVIGKGAANTPPTIAPGPQDQIIELGQPVTFTATVTSPLTFSRQWRRGTATFANITGATAATYSINEVKLTDAQKYQLRATNTVGTKQSADSTAAALTVVDRTASSQNVEITKAATFTISAATAPGSPLTYVWKKDGDPVLGNASAATNKLTLSNLVLANAGTYTCEVTGPGGTMTGGDQVLTVFDRGPVISSTPAPSPSLSLKAFAAAAPSDITLTLPEAFLEGDYDYQIALASPANGNASSYTCTTLPAGLVFDNKTGRLYGVPTRAGSYPLTFRASNFRGFSTATGTLTVSPVLGNSVTGSYLGLIERGPLTGGLGGRLDMTVAITRAFSGKLSLGSSAVSFVGRLASGGLSTSITIFRTGLPNLTLTLTLDSANNRFAASGCTLTDGTNTSAFSGWRVVWSTLNAPTTYLGAYNFAMSAPASSPVDTIPLGHGYGTLSVQARGLLTTAGRLPDGDTFTISSLLGPNGEVALFNVVTGRSSLHGSTQINPGATNAANTLATGSLTWTRPATTIGATTKTTLYAAGFGPIALTCEGGRYTAPVAPGLLMGKAPGTGNAMLRFYDANIGGPPSPADCAVTLTTSKATVGTTTTFTNIAITGATGSFTGGFRLKDNHPFLSGAPSITRSVTFQGLIVPTASGQRGYGYFLLTQLPVNTFPTPPTPSLSGGVELE
ncbi:MAG: choice-of-anchor D domain-containing protein, partial [Verrucomicrobia bacterium]|nr:choice-of-anchor D domain-containing protein [Verrucomicrobiota bacterium]